MILWIRYEMDNADEILNILCIFYLDMLLCKFCAITPSLNWKASLFVFAK